MAKKTLTLAELVVNLTAKSAAFNSELKRSNRKTRDWAAETREHVNRAGTAFAAMSVTASASLAVIYKQASKNIDALAKQSDRMGITTEDLGGLRHAAELTGVSQEKLDSSLERMVKRMGEAEQGIGASAKMLEQYDLANDDFFSKRPAEQFGILSDKIAGMKTSQEQAAFAAAVFGREGVALVNTAKLGSEGINDLTQEARDLGIVLSRVDAAKIEAANDAMTRAGSAFKGFSNSIAVEMAPLVTTFADMFTDATADSKGFRKEVVNGMEAIAISAGYANNALRGMHVIFKGLQIGATAVAGTVPKTLNWVWEKYAWVRNKLVPKSLEIDPKKSEIGIVAQEATNAMTRLLAETDALLKKDLPTDKIKEFFAEVRRESDETAKKIAQDAIATQEAVKDEFTWWNDTPDKPKDDDPLGVEEKEFTMRDHFSYSKSFFADMATLSQHGNKRLAEIGKAAAKINIGISTTEAAMNNYKWASSWGGPAAGAIAAAAAVTAGLMRLRQLEQGGIGGGSEGGLSGATTFDQGIPNKAVTPPEDSTARGAGETVIQQTIEIKALDGADVERVVRNNKEVFLQPVRDQLEEKGSLD